MPIGFKFDGVSNRSERESIKQAATAALGECSEDQWLISVSDYVLVPAYFIEVQGPGVSWGKFIKVDGDATAQVETALARLAAGVPMDDGRCAAAESDSALADGEYEEENDETCSGQSSAIDATGPVSYDLFSPVEAELRSSGTECEPVLWEEPGIRH